MATNRKKLYAGSDLDDLLHFKLAGVDNAEPSYLGYLDMDGRWYIQKITDSTTVEYTKGPSGCNFSNRASETYGTFDATF